MYCRQELEEILHDAQATGQGAMTGDDGDDIDFDSGGVIDPHLRALSTPGSRVSPAPSGLPNRTIPHYNRSKRRPRVEFSDDEDTASSSTSKKPATSKVDIGSALSSLSNEIRLNREQKEKEKSVSQQAIGLLETAYGKRLELMEFIHGCTFLKDEGNAGIFLAITEVEKRDRWLEVSLGVDLMHFVD